jgi:serine/threonine-protein kinase RsbW
LLRSEQFNDRDIFAIRLAVEEALVNAIKHGNQQDRNKQVMLSYYLEDDAFCIRIRDEGPGFDPTSVPDPTLQENLERCSGRGLMLMRYYMTEVHFLERGNLVIMKKLRNGTTAKSSA